MNILRLYRYFIFATLIMTTSCAEERKDNCPDTVTTNCKGEWSEIDKNGLVRKKFVEYWHQGIGACVTETKELNQFEKTLLERFDHGVTCTPQQILPNLWLQSANNYYTYKNSRIYLELNSSTGEARRMIVGEMPDGSASFIRQVFCYYIRVDIENELVNPTNYGPMLLADLEEGASSSIFHPMEIYNFQYTGSELLLQKMDDNSGVNWKFCPTNTPWGFCDYLRNGNSFYYSPMPDVDTQSQLRAAAILIRSEMNFTRITENEFEEVWESIIKDTIETGSVDYINTGGKWEYLVNSIFDEPLFVGRAWRDYLRGDRPYMPNVDWASSMQMPFVCYSSIKEVTLANGTSWIEGETCYENGIYSWSPF